MQCGIAIDDAIVTASIDDFEWIMVNGDLEDGVTYSRWCWEVYSGNPTFDFFDRCAAFDFGGRMSVVAGGGRPLANILPRPRPSIGMRTHHACSPRQLSPTVGTW